ncbi:MAG TPA: lytic transglycosylase domain-containing protein, partial [Pseudorhizobium sp.]|nr:lytic transglycosylase domain-containing protein [Pseudorhizobium sp.]
MKKSVLLLTALATSLSSGASFAGPVPESAAPLPYVKPDAPRAAAFPMPLTGDALPRMGRLAPGPVLKIGLDAVADRNASRARSVREGLPEGSLERQILTWAIATSGMSGVSSGEILAAEQQLVGWPGL